MLLLVVVEELKKIMRLNLPWQKSSSAEILKPYVLSRASLGVIFKLSFSLIKLELIEIMEFILHHAIAVLGCTGDCGLSNTWLYPCGS